MEDFGFIITRNITQPHHNEYWRKSVRCIRQFHTEPILIIDDNSTIISDYEKEKQEFLNINIIKSEIPGAGEILGYYYGYVRMFKTFAVIHDSMFLSKPFTIMNINTVRFLWHFEKYLGQTVDDFKLSNNDRNMDYINKLPISISKTIEQLYFDKNAWVGCFGVSSVIKLDFVDILFNKYDLENIIHQVKIRHDREAMERVFALICINTDPTILQNPSIYGSIISEYHYNGLSWSGYIQNCKQLRHVTKLVKIFSRR